jgi:hypothetical protein
MIEVFVLSVSQQKWTYNLIYKFSVPLTQVCWQRPAHKTYYNPITYNTKNVQRACLIHKLHLFISSTAENMLLLGKKKQYITLPALSMPLQSQQWSRNIPSVLGVIVLNEPSLKESDLNHEKYTYYTNSWTAFLFAHSYIVLTCHSVCIDI